MQNCKSSFDHAVRGELDYGFRWTLPDGVTITGSSWEMDKIATLTSDQILANVTSVKVNDLVEGEVYILTNYIEMSDGNEDSRSLTLSCKKRFP